MRLVLFFALCLTASAAALLSPRQASQPASAPMLVKPNTNRVDFVIASQLRGTTLWRWHGLVWETNANATIVDVTNPPSAPNLSVNVSWQDQTTLLTTTDLTGGWREIPVTATRTVRLPQVAQQFFRRISQRPVKLFGGRQGGRAPGDFRVGTDHNWGSWF